jgi:hypothetical protein
LVYIKLKLTPFSHSLYRPGTMVEKLHNYQGFLGRLHAWREDVREKWCAWREEHSGYQEGHDSGFPLRLFCKKSRRAEPQLESPVGHDALKYSHIYR